METLRRMKVGTGIGCVVIAAVACGGAQENPTTTSTLLANPVAACVAASIDTDGDHADQIDLDLPNEPRLTIKPTTNSWNAWNPGNREGKVIAVIEGTADVDDFLVRATSTRRTCFWVERRDDSPDGFVYKYVRVDLGTGGFDDSTSARPLAVEKRRKRPHSHGDAEWIEKMSAAAGGPVEFEAATAKLAGVNPWATCSTKLCCRPRD